MWPVICFICIIICLAYFVHLISVLEAEKIRLKHRTELLTRQLYFSCEELRKMGCSQEDFNRILYHLPTLVVYGYHPDPIYIPHVEGNVS